MISFVIPVYNEEDTVSKLYEQIEEAAKNKGLRRFEVIFVDDGSQDKSWLNLRTIAAHRPETVKAFRFRRNFGKAQALSAGFHFAKGDIIFTMDADLQDDPKEISKFLEKI